MCASTIGSGEEGAEPGEGGPCWEINVKHKNLCKSQKKRFIRFYNPKYSLLLSLEQSNLIKGLKQMSVVLLHGPITLERANSDEIYGFIKYLPMPFFIS